MAFLTDGVITTSLAAALGTQEANLGAHWTEIITRSHAEAYEEIVNKLTARGFTLSQITSWDGGAQCERLHSLYYCFLYGASAVAGILNAKDFNQGPKLDKMGALVISGVWTKPGNTTDEPGMVSGGAFDTSGDRFKPFDDDDTTGETIQW